MHESFLHTLSVSCTFVIVTIQRLKPRLLGFICCIVKWLKYCRYGVKHQPINLSVTEITYIDQGH